MIDAVASVVHIQYAVHAVHLLQVKQPVLELDRLASPLPDLRLLRLTRLLLDLVVLRTNRTKIVLVSSTPVPHMVEKLTDRHPQARLLDGQQPIPCPVDVAEVLDISHFPLHSAVPPYLVCAIFGWPLADDVAHSSLSHPATGLDDTRQAVDGLDADGVLDLSDINPHLQDRSRDERPLKFALDEPLEDGLEIFLARVDNFTV